jgi:hypothetical protein
MPEVGLDGLIGLELKLQIIRVVFEHVVAIIGRLEAMIDAGQEEIKSMVSAGQEFCMKTLKE